MGSNNLTARNNRSFMGQVCRVWTVEGEHLVSSVEAFWCGVRFRKQSFWAASLECDPLDCTEWGQATGAPNKNNVPDNSVCRGHESGTSCLPTAGTKAWT